MSNGVSGRKDEDNSDDETQRLPQVDELAAAPAQPASPEQPSTPDTEVEDDVMAGEAPPHAGAGQPGPPGRRRRRWVIPGVLVLLVAAGYVGVAWYFGDHVPSGTSVAGVDIGGEERQGAITLLEDSLAEVTSTAIPVTLGTEEDSGVDIDPDGLSFDAQATVDGQVGFSLAPDRVFSHLFGGRSVAPQVQVDEDQVTDTLEQVAPDLNIEPVEGAIAFTDGEPEVTEPEIGTSMDVPAAVDLLGSEWLTGERPFTLPTEDAEPAIGQDAIDAAMSQIVEPLLSGPVTIDLDGEDTVEYSPEDLTALAALTAEGADLQLSLDEEELADMTSDRAPSVGESPEDASIELKDGEPHITESVAGAGVDPEELADEVAAAAVSTGDDRDITMDLATTEPDFTTADAEELGVDERVSHFTTPMPHDPVRTQNLDTGTEQINNTLIKPGETFSLLEALGPIDASRGYTSSEVVVDGFATEAVGGGLSQLSTTTFNAAFEAGMQDVTHQPHSRYFDRYPEGREATLFEPNLDMQWKNNTPYGVLVQAWVADSKTQVALWSSDYWDVSIDTGDRTNITSPTTVYNTADDCQPESGGQSGFTVAVNRSVSRDSEQNEEYSGSYSHTYQPWNKVVCGEKPSDDD